MDKLDFVNKLEKFIKIIESTDEIPALNYKDECIKKNYGLSFVRGNEEFKISGNKWSIEQHEDGGVEIKLYAAY